MTSLLKQLATNAINWDTGQHSALRTQEPQGQVPSLPSWWFNRIEMAPSSQPACHRKPSQGWSQGCSWMWQVSPRISWLTQGLPTLTWPPSLEPSPLNHFGCYKKKITKRFTQALFCCWDRQIFSHQFLVVPDCPTSLLERSFLLKPWSYCSLDRKCFKTLFWGKITIF